MENKLFNIRVYGLLINAQNEVLLSDEEEYGKRFIKFPGGGLEYGEGLADALKREFMEECNLGVELISHFYTTDFFVESAFGGGQLISVYYMVKALHEMGFPVGKCEYDFENQNGETKQCFRFVSIATLTEEQLTFPVDRYIVKLLKNKYL